MMRNISHFLECLKYFGNTATHDGINIMFETPSSPKFFLFSKDEEAGLIIANLSHVKKVAT